MAHFARLDKDNVVVQVIVVGNDDIKDSDGNESEAIGIKFCQELYGNKANWIQTSYNSRIRFRYAGIGAIYDQINDVFLAPQPFQSFTLNKTTWNWEPPVPYPDELMNGGHGSQPNFEGEILTLRFFTADHGEYVTYGWDEASTSWENRTVIALAPE
jgi:hypothetical protein